MIRSTGTEHLPSQLFQSVGLPGEGAGKLIQVMIEAENQIHDVHQDQKVSSVLFGSRWEQLPG